MGNVRTNFGGTHIQAWHVQALYVGGYRIVPLTGHAALPTYGSIGHYHCGQAQNLLPTVPSFEGIGLVSTNEQVQISLWLFSLQLLERVHRVGGAFAVDLAPGILATWLWVGGNPLDLVQLPMLATDLAQAQPALVALAIGWMLAAIGDAAFGRSLGKRLLRLRIVDARTGAPASFGRRLLRSVLSTIPVASPLVMLVATLHPFGDGPAEMLSQTAVVPEEPLGPVDPDAGSSGGG
jgi:uncharacterized RDD family membrane protein YckC